MIILNFEFNVIKQKHYKSTTKLNLSKPVLWKLKPNIALNETYLWELLLYHALITDFKVSLHQLNLKFIYLHNNRGLGLTDSAPHNTWTSAREYRTILIIAVLVGSLLAGQCQG